MYIRTVRWSSFGEMLSLFVIYDKSDTMYKMRINWKIEDFSDICMDT